MNRDTPTNAPLDLAAIRSRLASARGRQYWRSLEELAETEEFQELLRREFPRQASVLDAVSRRRFLQLMGASLALAGLNACTRKPTEKIVPYVRAPEEIIPGKPLFFATAAVRGGMALGVLVESHMGRPTKVEGNPQHPASLGATDAFAQASVLSLYDPDRSQVVTHLGQISTWNAFLSATQTNLALQRITKGAGLRILTETVTSPTLASQLQTLLNEFPAAKWHQYDPVGRDNARAGAALAFGEHVDTRYDLRRADVILSLDADFLFSLPGSVRYAREFAARRRVQPDRATMNRLYVAESSPSLTGSMADHRLPLRPGEIGLLARAVAQRLGVLPGAPPGGQPLEQYARWIDAVARDLQQHRGAGVVIVGDSQPPVVHALGHALNAALGNVGATVAYTPPAEARPVDHAASLRELVADMEAGRVEILVFLGANPAYTAPADLKFAEHVLKVKLRVHWGLYHDETAALCHWHIPATHPLESWSDARAYDGTVTILQPLIAPLYDGRSAHEVLTALRGQPGRSSHDIVRDHWKQWYQGDDFERFWQTALHDGVVAGTTLTPKPVSLRSDWAQEGAEGQGPGVGPRPQAPPALTLIFRPDPTVWDGSFANNGWLQELPKPLTKLTWDNAALISPATAERLGLANEDVVELRLGERAVRAPVWILPGHAEDSVTVSLGYGRTRAGRVGSGAGFNAYLLRPAETPWYAEGLEIRKTGLTYRLACTQNHHSLEGRPLVLSATLAEYQEHPDFVHEFIHAPAPETTLYPPYRYEGYAWGMAIDINACIGCGACVVACQAENNIPIVGKEQVIVGREMHWLRVDRYYKGDLDNPETYYQPIPCMHCENAPCEVVCPVAATAHSAEGLNDMVYNRCVGTRYCANNCPYKVRRFNFLQYADSGTPGLQLLYNPDVTVRTRGVMEKCTYCVQRINAARIEAKLEDRRIRDGEVMTACQQACPTQAIVFGDINDPTSLVSRLKAEPRNYPLLAELNTRPRTTYLARLRNPNPAIAESETE
jgi:molybdopterin-containing oxidoreductase family iron-sulfur binding subunit